MYILVPSYVCLGVCVSAEGPSLRSKARTTRSFAGQRQIQLCTKMPEKFTLIIRMCLHVNVKVLMYACTRSMSKSWQIQLCMRITQMCSLIRGLCVHNYTFICFLVCLCMRRGTVTPKQGSCARRENKYSFTSIGEEWARRARHQARHTGKRPTIKRKRRGSTITQTTVQWSA